MKLKNNKSGFTLLEIIIVIIIVGVMASLALPKFFSTVNFSKSTEAVNMMGDMRRRVENCSMMSGTIDYQSCVTLTAIGYPDPHATAEFSYTMTDSTTGPQAGTVDLLATYIGTGFVAGDTISFKISAVDGTVAKLGGGIFVSIK